MTQSVVCQGSTPVIFYIIASRGRFTAAYFFVNIHGALFISSQVLLRSTCFPLTRYSSVVCSELLRSRLRNAVGRVHISINSVLDDRGFAAYVYARFNEYTVYLFPSTNRRKNPLDTVQTQIATLVGPRQYAYHDAVNAKSSKELFRFEKTTGKVTSLCVTRWSLCLHHLHQGQ